MEGSHSEQWERGITWVRILGISVLCILVALLLFLGITRQDNEDEGVEVLSGLVENQAAPGSAVGADAGGFETWILVQNPGVKPVHVNLVLNTEYGSTVLSELQNLEIPAGSRRSFPLHEYVHTYHVSTLVQATDGEVVCERAMYWNNRKGGHDSIGVTAPAPQWYLAEGATAGEFETWVLVQNPGDRPVHINLVLNTESGEVRPSGLQDFTLAPETRVSFNLDGFIEDYHVSTLVQATDGEVVCERAMYWTPQGQASRTGGHDSIGATAPASTWYLAEGATAGEFETWVLVQNPQDEPVHVNFILNTESGEVRPDTLQGFEIPARSRISFNLDRYVDTYHVSTLVQATDGEVVCERAMYWTPPGQVYREEGHDSIGVTAPAPQWYLAEGATAGEFETWVLVQNPQDEPVHVNFILNTESGEVRPATLQGFEIPARSRISFNLDRYVDTYHVSTLVQATDGEVVCERAMYWNNRTGGHDSIGATAPASTWYLAEGATSPGGGPGGIELRVKERAGVARSGEITTSGVPLPRDFNVYSPDDISLFDTNGSPVPCQKKVTARWGGSPDDASKPVKWVLLDFPASVGASGESAYFLRRTQTRADPPAAVNVSDDGSAVTVNTGAAVFRMRRDSFDLFNSVELAGVGPVLVPSTQNGFVITAGGTDFRSSLAPPASIAIEEAGPLRAAVCVRGSHAATTGATMLDYTARIQFYAGSAQARVLYTLENHNPTQPDGTGQPQCWDIGCPGSASFSGLYLGLQPDVGASPTAVLATGEGGSGPFSSGTGLSLYQDSSGSDWWGVHRGHFPRPQSYVSFRGWTVRAGGSELGRGNRAQAWLDLSGNGRGLAVGLRDFWQNHPKGIGSSGGEIRLSLFPTEYGGDFWLRPGEHKTHEILLYFHGGGSGQAGVAEVMAAMDSPLLALASPQWYADSGALGRMVPRTGDSRFSAYDRQNLAAFDASIGTTGNSLLASIEENDFYGWCDFGDVPLDYETPSGQMNLKYNFDFGMLLQFLRSGDYRWWELAGPACRHVADEDILHYEGAIDHWSDGGYFGHSYHDEPGDSNPHRNYGAPHPDLYFAAPGCLLYYYLTGYVEAQESALEVIENTRYRYENSYGRGNGEGWADGYNDYGSDSFRPFSNGLRIMTDAYEATGDAKYLATADWIIENSHLAADPFLAAPQPGADGGTSIFSLDLFTFSLGRYLDALTSAGIPDGRNTAAYLVSLVRHEVDTCWRTGSEGYQGFPYAWSYSGVADETFGVVNLCNWHLLSADCLAYGYIYGGGDDLLGLAGQAFRTGSERPNGEGTEPGYWSTKESVNSAVFGQVYMEAIGNR